ncbi:MAG: DUF1311 domain-containing protein [Burkholderiaceae bacterium]|nr:MAG: DUF1311 domain-containing protein [Burkholderiaceae bacterium]
MVRVHSLIVLVTLVALSPARGAEEDFGCAGPDTSTFFDACVNLKKAQRLELAISRKLEELSKSGPSGVAESELASSQAEWARYRDRACNAQQLLMGGTNSVSYARCSSFLAQQRLEYLQANY